MLSFLWPLFWLAFGLFVVVAVWQNYRKFLSTEWYGRVRTMLYIAMALTVASFVINFIMIKTGNPPFDILLFVQNTALWSLLPLILARVAQEIGMKLLSRAGR